MIKEKKQLFDIIVGTSAGAINSTLLVHHVFQKEGNQFLVKVQQKCFINFDMLLQ